MNMLAATEITELASSMDITVLTAISRIALAALLGALIGVEREYRGRSAGVRTQLLVALGSSLAMVVSLQFAQAFGGIDAAASTIRVDPARVAYGVMTGVGFLGAGAVICYGVNVRGLTTAASLWCTAAVGLAAGFGMYEIAMVATLIVIFTLLILPKLDQWIPSRQYKCLVITAASDQGITLDSITKILQDRKVKIVDMEYHHDFQQGQECFTMHIALLSYTKARDILKITDDLPELISLTIR